MFMTLALLMVNNTVSAQGPCREQAPGCRPLTSVEVTALRERFLALKAALPVPDPSRYALADGVGENYTMPFVAEVALVGGQVCFPWPSECFIEKNDILNAKRVKSMTAPQY
jgi:hypothetical protein